MHRVTIATVGGESPVMFVRIGSQTESLPCEYDPADEALLVPSALIDRLGLIPDQSVHVQADSPGHTARLHVGPLVGVLLRHVDAERLDRSGRYRQMVAEARMAGTIPYFFSIEGVDFEQERCQGWLNRDGTWEEETLPLPDVIYHRATYGDSAKRRAASALIRDLVRLKGVSLLNNANSFSKRSVNEALRFFADSAELAPLTLPFDHFPQFAELLARYPSLFVKADHGSHGSDVVRLTAEGEEWRVLGKINGRTVDEVFSQTEQVYAFLCLAKDSRVWVVQEGIDVPQVGGCVFDVRVILQKDNAGEWVAALTLVRLAEPHKVAANMSQGGRPYLPSAFLREFGEHLPGFDEMDQRASDAAVQTALALEARFGLLGEVGVDIAVDRTCRPWVLEANAKPLHPELPDMPMPLVRYPFHYATHLAGRAWNGLHTGLGAPRSTI